jgi:2-polyprenyl-6-methoxyphenol hydroxylase-like FAD-dependent oxidoreductase
MTNAHDAQDAQVIIVGGGPVGMGLAIEFGLRGISCIVVERYAQPQRIPKGQNLTQRTMEHFFFWGAEEPLRAARTIPREYGIGGLTAYRTLLGDYTYDWLQRGLVRPFYFTDNERLPQYATETVLRRRAAEIPAIRTLYGWSAERVAQDDGGVDIVIAQREGPDRRTLRAQYAVGCDGSRSLVREQAGISQTRSDHDRLMVLLVFRSRELHRLLERFPGKSYYNVLDPALKGYWKFFGRVDLGTTWFFHAPVPRGTTQDNVDFRRYLFSAVGAEFDVEFEHVGFWELRIAIADGYRQGRVFLAGDAAHSHPPYGGYGVNTGFEDAKNLGWKLAAVLHGWGGAKLLDSYDEERRPVFQSTARDFIEHAIERDRHFLEHFSPERDKNAFEREWQARQSGATAEVDAFEPHYEGSSIVWGPSGSRCSAVGAHAFTARPGHHLAPAPLSSQRNVYEALGENVTLLGLDASEAALDAFTRAAACLRIPLTVIRDDRAGERARYGAGLVLIRPDQFVAWASAGDDVDAAAVLRRAIGADEPRSG